MSVPRFENLTTQVDNVATLFTLSRPYKPGTLAIFENGLLRTPSDDDFGWTETSPALGTFTTTTAPKVVQGVKDILQVFYLDTEPFQDEISPITGTLAMLELAGLLDEPTAITGAIQEP